MSPTVLRGGGWQARSGTRLWSSVTMTSLRRNPATPRQRLTLLGILLLALVLRIVWVEAAQPATERFLSDPTFYRLAAEGIADGQGYRNAAAVYENIGAAFAEAEPIPIEELPHSAFYPPGYPAALAAVFWLGEHTPLTGDPTRLAAWLNVVLGTASVLLLFLVVQRLADTRTGLVAATMLAVYPNIVARTGQSDYLTLFVFLSLAVILVILSLPAAGGVVRLPALVWLALLIGATTYVRPTVALLLPALAVLWRAAGASWRRATGQVVVIAAVLVVLLVPWTIRNAVRLDAPVVMSTGIGPALCASRHPGAHGGFTREALDRHCFDDVSALPLDEQEVRNNAESTRRAISFVLRNPVSEVNQWFWRTVRAYESDRDAVEAATGELSDDWLPVWLASADAAYFGALALAPFGALAFLVRRSPPRTFFLLAAGTLAVVPLLLYGDVRYKVPLVPLLLGLAAVAAVAAFDAARAGASGARVAPPAGPAPAPGAASVPV